MTPRPMLVAAILFGLVVAGSLPIRAARTLDQTSAQEHVAWVAESLKRMQAVKVGMTRSDLLKVFVEEGGISTREWRHYASRDCKYFKVRVEFRPVGPADYGMLKSEGTQDVIIAISQPYLQWSILD